MKHLRSLGLCLLAVFALGAVVASAAQAEGPEWGRCVKLVKNKGKYKDKNCQELEGKTNGKGEFKAKAKGFYEWEGNASTTCYKEPAKKGKYKNATCTELEGKTNGKGEFKPKEKGEYEKVVGGTKFTAKGGVGVLKGSIDTCHHEEETAGRKPRAFCEEGYQHVAAQEIECTTESATGEAAGTNEIVNVSILFKGCNVFGESLHTVGFGPGEIKVSTLKGRLGYLNKSATPRQVGVVLEPVVTDGAFASFRTENPEIALEFVVGVGNNTEGAWHEPEATGGYDGVISPITPVNEMTHTLTQPYRTTLLHAGEETEEFQNVPSHFEGERNELLEVYAENWSVPGNPQGQSTWSSAGEEITNVDELEGEDEIKA